MLGREKSVEKRFRLHTGGDNVVQELEGWSLQQFVRQRRLLDESVEGCACDRAVFHFDGDFPDFCVVDLSLI